jgi:hypothetical protein
MSTPKSNCQKPEALKGKPSECSPAQIKTCHGAEAAHPCAPKRRAK